MKARLAAGLLIGAVWLMLGAGIAQAEPTEACRLLASRFAAAPASVDPRELVDLSSCVVTELAVRAGGIEPSASQQPPPSAPPNVFPSPPVPSPPVPSPVIPTPEQSGAAPTPPAASQAGAPQGGPRQATAQRETPISPYPQVQPHFGAWPPPAAWGQNWPVPGPWERP
jgi:hypothetical protein